MIILGVEITAVAFVPAAVAVTRNVVHPGLRAVSLSLCVIVRTCWAVPRDRRSSVPCQMPTDLKGIWYFCRFSPCWPRSCFLSAPSAILPMPGVLTYRGTYISLTRIGGVDQIQTLINCPDIISSGFERSGTCRC